MTATATIAAVATAPGRGGVGIIRVSGPLSLDIARHILGFVPVPRHARHCSFLDRDQRALDEGIALFFAAPHSFTGEDVLELQAHGGPVILDLILQRTVQLGARLARPGEFSERAFLNDKIDLAQAEAIADLIEASSEQAARNAVNALQGAFSRQIHALVEALIALRIYVEAAIDFPEEEIDFLSDGKVAADLDRLIADLQLLLQQARQGAILREGMKVVIAGRPNAGKSSLLNALAARDTAIVTPIEGTTRDILREHIQIDGMPLHIIDTAGLREAADEVERIGIQRARREIENADRVLMLLDSSGLTPADGEAILPQGMPPERTTVVLNKIDLTAGKAGLLATEPQVQMGISAKTGAGLDRLKQHLKDCMGYSGSGEGGFIARRRHIDALQRSLSLLQAGRRQLLGTAAGELLAEDLRQAQNALGEITGAFTPDDLLGRIFSSFCIGK